MLHLNVSMLFKVTGADSSKCLVYDENKNLIPDGPGEVISLLNLSKDHVSVKYLQDRGFDITSLVGQFNCSWCFEEAPESKDMGRFYKNLPGGFKDTSRCRIIFEAWIDGVRKGWQARMLDRTVNNVVEIYHPYDEEFVKVFELDPETKKPSTLLLGNDTNPKAFDISKYKTGFGVKRTQVLLGFDAMLQWNKENNKSVAVLVEGPLDAGKLGPPAVSMMGKFLSEGQANLFKNKIDKVLFIRDNDAAGLETSKKVIDLLQRYVKVVKPLELPRQFKDLGEMSMDEAAAFVEPYF